MWKPEPPPMERDKLGIPCLAMCCRCHQRYPVDDTGEHGPWCPECVEQENQRAVVLSVEPS